MTAVDTSVVVAAMAGWHRDHDRARTFLEENEVVLIGHVAVETFSVLTRMPPPRRVAPEVVARALVETFGGTVAALPANAYLDLIRSASDSGVQGGAVYDALVAATAKEAGAALVSLDQRAAATYASVGAAHQLL